MRRESQAGASSDVIARKSQAGVPSLWGPQLTFLIRERYCRHFGAPGAWICRKYHAGASYLSAMRGNLRREFPPYGARSCFFCFHPSGSSAS
eukprot:1505830-Pyramimonas_sp.AAC.1